ncbi:TolC family protein [Alloacidobacterium dinghuense]|uniref:TolC family protein n=1 Tax=Alloacidobacterium dinghuense TaxID=2763107 RepID=A0A7G8BJP2_9BACT|nr:TolC family protein [Alloacidobacterium dinghuense]QNI32762.1 TolC family protein [Alloacidobacterium dinghuense]
MRFWKPHPLTLFVALSLAPTVLASAQAVDGAGASPSFGSITTPRPINPATDTTNPSASATQSLNPYLGSTPEGPVVDEEIRLSLEEAVSRGLKFNLGLIDSEQANAQIRAQREHALAELLPQISARAEQTYQQFSYKELNIKLPPASGLTLPPTSGGFGYSEAQIQVEAPIVNMHLRESYKQQKALETASVLSAKDARDVVVFAVGAAYFQVVASHARLETAKAALASAQELNRQVEDQYKNEVSPEIDSLRARVELSTAQQRIVDATNDLEKDKLTLDRITGIPLAQRWKLSGDYGYLPLLNPSEDEGPSSQTRYDVASAKQEVVAAELGVKAARAERLPEVSFTGSYGGGGNNPANYNQLYDVQGGVNVPIFTSGRIRSDVHAAEAVLTQRRAEYRDLQGRADYDVRVARLDAQSSESAVKVAQANQRLAQKALEQSEDRYNSGVTNYLEVLEAQEAQVTANENYIASLFSFNVAKIALARALGTAESRLPGFFKQQ